MPKSDNITPIAHRIRRTQRHAYNAHKGGVLWLTGLSSAGKSTLGFGMEQLLFTKKYQSYVLDGDNIRGGLNQDLGFSDADRTENIRRVSEVAALFADAGIVTIASFISPYRKDRQAARDVVGDNFHEIYIKADLAVCEKRDQKGLYKKARRGKIKQFTGISSPYEPPLSPELIIDTETYSIEECIAQIEQYVDVHFRI